MKIFKNFIGLAALALCLGFASCGSDDDAPSYSNVAVSNSELMTILKAKGYQFDENGKMLLDDKANSTTSLDLSGTKVDTAALKELSVFPNLKELNLSSNGYGPVFHIASLPSQITGLDLQGNDIYDFDGLVTAKVENDEVKATILHEFTKLYLPASCKYNVEDLMPFYTQNEAENKTVDMQMVNDKGSLEKYNTLREIPDTYFRTFLKMKFASLFVDDSKSDSHSFSVNADITRVFNDKGTSISLTGSYSDSKSTNESHSLSETTYYQLENSLGGDSVLYRNQYQHSPSTNRAYSVGINLTQPLAENLRLQLGYRYSATRQMSDRSTYESEVYMDSLSNHTLSKTITHDLSLYLNYDGKQWEANAGVLMQPERRSLDQKTGLLHADTVRTSVNWNPQLNVSWHRGKTRFELNYDGSSRQPDLGSLVSLTDNSDPLHVTHGNPSLKAAYSQNFRLMGRNTRLGLSGDVNFSNTYNSQTQAVFYNLATGGTETYPVNVNGNWNMRASLRYQKRWKKRFNLSARTGASFAQSVALVNEGKSEEPDRSVTHNTSYNANLRLGYQPKWGGFDLQGDWRYRHATNQLRGTSNYTRSYNFSLNTYAELPLGFQVKSDVAYSFRNGTNIKKGEDDQVVWNLGASWRFLRKKQAELSFYWSDILSDKKNYYRNVTATGLTESRTFQIGSYFIISFKYRINKQL